MFSQFICFAYFRSSLNIIPRILILMFFFNCNIRSVFWIFNISFVLIGRVVVFSRFIVVPVALFRVSKNLSTFAAYFWFFRNRLVSSAY